MKIQCTDVCRVVTKCTSLFRANEGHKRRSLFLVLLPLGVISQLLVHALLEHGHARDVSNEKILEDRRGGSCDGDPGRVPRLAGDDGASAVDG